MKRLPLLPLLLLVLLTSADARADVQTDYRDGFRAFQNKRWDEVIRLMGAARAGRTSETAKRDILIYGSIYEPYIPSYFIGLAYFRKGDCSRALDAWESTAQAGAIGGTRYAKDFTTFREQCRAKETPAAIKTAEQPPSSVTPPPPAVSTSTAAVAAPPTALRPQSTPTQRPQAENPRADEISRTADAARAELARAQAAIESLAPLRFEKTLKAVWETDANLGQREAAATQQLRSASQRLDAAERARSLDDLKELQRIFATARQTLEKVRADATTLKNHLDANSDRELRAEKTRRLRSLHAALDKKSSDVRELLKRFESAPNASTEARKSGSELERLWKKSGGIRAAEEPDKVEAYLTALDHAISAARMAARRLPDQKPGQVPGVLRDAANAYFAGDYAGVVGILAKIEIPATRAAAQAHLFRAAARFALFHSGGATDRKLLDAAAADVRACRKLDTSASPRTDLFSPRFSAFFRTNG